MSALAAVLAFGLLLVVLINRERVVLLYPLLVAFGLRVSAAIVNLHVVEFPGHRRGDASVFESYATELANLRWEAFVDAFQLGDPYLTYGWIVGLIYRIIGHSPLVPHVLNAFLGTVVVFLIFKTTRILWNETAAIRAMWVAAVFPSFLHYHSILLREVWVALGFTLSAYFFARYLYNRKSFYNAILSLSSMGLATIFHGGMVAGLAGLLLYFFWRFIRLWRDLIFKDTGALRGEFMSTNMVIAISLPLLIYGFAAGVNINKVGDLRRLVQLETFVEEATEIAEARLRGGAQYPSFLSLQGADDVLLKTVPRTVYLLFSPFPWDVRALVHAIAMIDSLIYLLLFYYIFARWRLIKRENVHLMLIILVPLIIAFSIGTSNFGAAMRHRAKIAPLIICMFPVFPSLHIFREHE